MDPFTALSQLSRRRTASADTPALDVDRDAVFLLDASLVIESVNRAAARLLGYDRENLVGKPVASVVGRAGLANPRTSLPELFRDARVPASLALALIARDGERVEVRLTRIRLGGGDAERFLCIARPVDAVPVRLPHGDPPAEPAVGTVPGPHPGVDEPRRILVAAYSGVSRRVLTRLLERQGHEVEAVSTGADAVARAVAGELDLVLVEGRLPDLPGDELAAALRERCGDAAPRVIGMVTPTGDPAAYDAVLDLPARPGGLARAIRSVLPRAL